MRIPFNPANSVRYHARKLRFLPACVLAGLAVYPLAIVLTIPLAFLITAISDTGIFPGLQASVQRSPRADPILLASVGFVCVGFLIGLLQKNLVRRYFKVDLGRWRLVSMLGACVAGMIVVHMIENIDCLIGLMRDPLGARFYDYYDFMQSLIYAPMIQFALVTSALQTAWLYRYVRMAWLWLVANVLAGLLFFWLYAYAFAGLSFMSWLVAAIVQALIVGHAMRFLLTQRRRGGKAKRDDSLKSSGLSD